MVTIARSRQNDDRGYGLFGTVARSDRTGAIHGYDRIVEARFRLESPIWQSMRDAMRQGSESTFRRSPPRRRELERALDGWENEGGARPPASDGAFPTTRPPTSPLAGLSRYLNDIGAREITIGVTAFHCVGALPPHDHPHIYLNMAGKPGILCPYCSTGYLYDERLRPDETEPTGCLYAPASETDDPADGGGS